MVYQLINTPGVLRDVYMYSTNIWRNRRYRRCQLDCRRQLYVPALDIGDGELKAKRRNIVKRFHTEWERAVKNKMMWIAVYRLSACHSADGI